MIRSPYDMADRGRAIPSGRAASLRPQPPSAFSQSGIAIASEHWDKAAAALLVRDYPTFDREMAAFKRISATWKSQGSGGGEHNEPSPSNQ